MVEATCQFSESPQPRIGVLVLENDETLEEDLRRVFAPDVARLHFSRVSSQTEVTPETLNEMVETIPSSADLLPKTPDYTAIGYGCTSGTMVIGAEKVKDLITGVVPADHITDPLTATFAAIETLGIKKLGLLTPYIPAVAAPLQHAFENYGINVTSSFSFGIEQEAKVARIARNSIFDAVRSLAQESDIDGVFMSCTNLRTFDVIPSLEDALNIPVLSSNQALCWHMAKLAGVADQTNGPGRLWGKPSS